MRSRSNRRRTAWGAAALVGGCALVACSSGSSAPSSTVGVMIEPGPVTIVAGSLQPFIATVTGTDDPTVVWSVVEGDAGGKISSTGVYLPAQPGTYHVAAVSRAEPSGRGRTEVTVVPSEDIHVSIASPELPAVLLSPGGSVAFVAKVTGTGNRNVMWTIDTGRIVPGGSISAEGVYTAPPLEVVRPYLEASGSITVVVRARSVVNLMQSATRPVVIQSQSSPVTISPSSMVVALGEVVTLALSEPVSGGAAWTVNDVVGGLLDSGTVSPFGVYTAPFSSPDPATVMVGNLAAGNRVPITILSRFLAPEVLSVQACLPSCPVAHPAAIAAEDFNGDGLSDLVIANPGSGTVSLVLAADASRFAVPYRLQEGGVAELDPKVVVARHLDGDAFADILTVSGAPMGGVVKARLGAGDGTFSRHHVLSEWPGAVDPVVIATGRFDSDSITDLVVADASARLLWILRGLGDGTFSLGATVPTEAAVRRPVEVAIADFDRSGHDDLAILAGDNTVAVWLTSPDGSFRRAKTIAFQAGQSPKALTAVDLNADLAADLVVALAAPAGVSVVLNTGTPQSGVLGQPSSLIAGGVIPTAVATGDFNRDRNPDVVIADSAAAAVTIFFGNGHGGLVRSETYLVGSAPDAVVTADFNGDGWDDIAVIQGSDDAVTILRNRGGQRAP